MHVDLLAGRRALLLAGALTMTTAALAADVASAAYTGRVEGQTLTLTGDAASDVLHLRTDSLDPDRLLADVGGDGTADLEFDRTAFTAIVVRAGAGDDEVLVRLSSPAHLEESVTLDGGRGADRLLGGSGAETLLGGDGNDVVVGGDGDDVALLGDGDDTYGWNPGDDSDVVEGQAGRDRLDFSGSAASEVVAIARNGSRARFTRDVGSVVTDLAGVERIAYRALGGTDAVTVHDLAGTAVTDVEVGLAGPGGGGDGAADTVTARGTGREDRFELGAAGPALLITGGAARVSVDGREPGDSAGVATLGGDDTIVASTALTGPAALADGGDGRDTVIYRGTEGADDLGALANGGLAAVRRNDSPEGGVDTTAEVLVVQGLAGDDRITAVGNLAALADLRLEGGDGDDTLFDGNGADTVLGGRGNDRAVTGPGADRILLGRGDDRFEWSPGDGSDAVDGEAGADTAEVSGSAAGESIALGAAGGRVLLTRDVGSIANDLAGFETLAVRTLAGTDTLDVGDLSGTGVTAVEADLAGPAGDPDGFADTVVLHGTGGRDHISLTAAGGRVLAAGLAWRLLVAGAEPALDALHVRTHGGDDDVTVGAGVSDLIDPVVDLGPGE